mgnify:CR=1 FL=1
MEEDKKTLENANQATKGSVSQQAIINGELIKEKEKLQTEVRRQEDIIANLNKRN